MVFWILLLILQIFPQISLAAESDFCLTPECIKAAASMISSVDPEVDPCDNFHKHVCGRWNKEHLIREGRAQHSWFYEQGALMKRDIVDFLNQENSDDEPEGVHKARFVYKICKDIETSGGKNGLDTLKEVLEGVGLSLAPPIKPVKLKTPLMKILANAFKLADFNIFIGFGLKKNPYNRTLYKLEARLPGEHTIDSLAKQDKIKKVDDEEEEEEDDDNMITLAVFEMRKFLKTMYGLSGKRMIQLTERINKAADDLKHIDDALEEIVKSEAVLLAQKEPLPEEMTVKELQALVDSATKSKRSKIRWADYINYLYQDVDVDMDTSKEIIYLSNKPYYQKLSKLFSRYSERQLALYVWYKIVYTLAPHVNEELIEAKQQYERGVGIHDTETREQFCADQVSSVMYTAVNYHLLLVPGIREKVQKATEMTENIMEAFISIVENSKWMGEVTKARTIEKAKAMRIVIGFPTDADDIDSYDSYPEVVFNDTNLMNFLTMFSHDALGQLGAVRNYDNETGTGLKIADINASYDQQQNLIFVPAGIIRFPFYGLGLEALNYGALGTILGHELTHGFDDTGRLYDKDGNYNEWWTEEANKEYEKRAECFVDKFNKHHVPEVNRTVNGNLTLSENIADSGGLLEAFKGYELYVKKHGKEKFLPGFQNYTHEQLLFLGFTHVWCSYFNNNDAIEEELNDEHSPDFVRTILTLQDSDAFLESWKCPKESKMHPQQRKCSIWVD